jgi:NAD(P)-dependent dehydrogenase (short-subunit alcohol dehydrogenase family)
MKANRCGRIINISSRASLGSKGLSSYSAAKCALIGLTRSWALELAEFNIAVNAIAPGFIETDLFRKQYPVGSAKYSNAIECTPLKRIGRPEEIAEAITFLLSENSGFITGQTLYIDGGRSL